MRKLALLLLLLPILTKAQPWSGLIDPKRATDWTTAGIPGGIPSANWPQCTLYAGQPAALPTSSTGAQIQAALSACSGTSTYVPLAAGTFNNIAGFGFNAVNHVALRGQGANSTHLIFSSAAAGCNVGQSAFICQLGQDGAYRGSGALTFHNWTAGYAQGATQLTFDSVAGMIAGTSVLILTQCDTGFTGATCNSAIPPGALDNGGYFECSLNSRSISGGIAGCTPNGEGSDGPSWRCNGCSGANQNSAWQQEVVLVTNIVGNVVTINRGLHFSNWSGSLNPQGVVIQMTQQIGIENLWMDGSTNSVAGVAIGLQNCFQCWVSGTAISEKSTRAIFAGNVAYNVYEKNYFFGNPTFYADNAAVFLNGGSNLIQNNICQQRSLCVIADGPSEGDVIAYNYAINQYGAVGGPGSGLMGYAYDGHSAGDNFQLFEGNVVDSLNNDNDHGTHLNQTYFRNFVTGWESCANGQCGSPSVPKNANVAAFTMAYGSRYFAFVGNVLGTPGYHNVYLTQGSGFGAGMIYQLAGSGPSTPSIPNDPLVYSTALLWGNYDTVTNAVRCNNSEVPTSAPTYPNPIPTVGCGGSALPASFYLASKPSWWGPTTPYPATGPDIINGNVGQCAGTLNTPGQQAGVAATNASQCTGTNVLNLAWGGHINANPAMRCYLSVMGGPPDGTGNILSFNANACYLNNGPVAVLTPNPLAFGSVNLGSNTTLVETLTNSGNANLVLNNPYFSFTGTNAADFSVSAATCTNSGTVAPNATCTVTIKFTPSLSSVESATFNILGNSLASVNMTGTGVAVTGAVTMFPGTTTGQYVQGCANSTGTTSISCTFANAQNLNDVIACGIADGTGTTFSSLTDTKGNNYGSSLLTNTVSFGYQSLFLTGPIVAAAAGANTITATFTGTPNGPEIKCSEYRGPLVVDVTSVGATATSGTTLNSGSLSTIFANDLLVGFGLGNITAAGTGYTLRYTIDGTDAAEDQLVTSAGNYSATFTQTNGAWLMQLMALQAPQSLIFASRNVTTTSPAQTITAQNSGGISSTLNSPASVLSGANAGDFAVSAVGTCTNGSVLTAGNSCSSSVTFTPSAAGTRTATLTWTSNNSSGTIALSGIGVAASQCGTPTFSPVAGTVTSGTVITFSGGCASGTYCSTLDGTTPTANGAGTCTHGSTGGTTTVTVTSTVNAISSKSGNSDSAVGTAAYTVNPTQLATPTFSPAAPYNGAATSVTVTLPGGSTGCYTLDNSPPTTNGMGACIHGTFYSAAIPINITSTLQVIATQSGFLDSAIASGAYTITNVVGLPTFAVVGTKPPFTQTVSITSPTSASTICYTLNGQLPTTDGNGNCTYGGTLTNGGTLTINQTTLINSIGTKSGFSDSPIAAAIFVAGSVSPPASPPVVIFLF
jgi:hypothetical protein